MSNSSLKRKQNLLSIAESNRRATNKKLPPKTKSALGQYMTPANIASFMASLFPKPSSEKIDLLDPGAGVGSLTSAFIDHFCASYGKMSIDLTAYEVDTTMQAHLLENLAAFDGLLLDNCRFTWELISRDFVIEASRMIASVESLWKEDFKKFSHCIMNPPYKKISTNSNHRVSLRTAGIETVNLYSAFVALSIRLLKKNGYMVAIIPRSFCNGPYYRPFREMLINQTALKRIHLFDSRNSAFKEDKVLQENIIIALEKDAQQGDVTISTSSDDSFQDLSITQYRFDQIVQNSDKELFIHIPTSKEQSLTLTDTFSNSLTDIGVNVSTGPVVDYRLKQFLRQMPGEDTVPLIYPCHFKKDLFVWPINEGKKPNAIMNNSETYRWLYPNGYYTVLRRFSSKEEKRRIVAGVIEPSMFNGAQMIGVENHLNVFHVNKNPLPENLARGLAIYLNSTIVDQYFRRFSGHTQVNATDLKLISYPDKSDLLRLGAWAKSEAILTQQAIDRKLKGLTDEQDPKPQKN